MPKSSRLERGFATFGLLLGRRGTGWEDWDFHASLHPFEALK